MDWDDFVVASTVVHYVPTSRDVDDPRLLLTKAAIDLDAELTAYFAAKITGRLEYKSLEVVTDHERDQTVPDALAGILSNAAEVVTGSQIVAERLFDVQAGTNSSGLLGVFTGALGGRPCVAVLKLERQRGISFAIDPETGTVDLELLRNLTLTDKTRVYKTALFFAGKDGDLRGYVADDQRTSASGSVVASFFLGRFLGCKPKEPAAELTYKFVKVVNESINADVDSAERRGRYQVAVLAKMQDNTADIRPKDFADQHFEPSDRQPFLDRLVAAGFDPKISFPKDTSRVKVNEFKMTFTSGMVLVGPPQALEDNVNIPEKPSRDHPVQLRDTVENVLTGR
jgi:hypothetical protein